MGSASSCISAGAWVTCSFGLIFGQGRRATDILYWMAGDKVLKWTLQTQILPLTVASEARLAILLTWFIRQLET